MGMHKSGKRPVRAKPVISRADQSKKYLRDNHLLTDQHGAYSRLDVHLSPTLQRRMTELGLAVIPDTVVASHRSPLRPTLFDQSLATKIVQ
jgi:hypothetical protein